MNFQLTLIATYISIEFRVIGRKPKETIFPVGLQTTLISDYSAHHKDIGLARQVHNCKVSLFFDTSEVNVPSITVNHLWLALADWFGLRPFLLLDQYPGSSMDLLQKA